MSEVYYANDMEEKLFRVEEKEIKEILAKHYGAYPSDISLHHDYHFVLKNGDKRREDFVYAVVYIYRPKETKSE